MLWSVIAFCVFHHYLVPISCNDLIGVVAIVGHGEVIPTEFYPNDPYKNSKLWLDQQGQLSNIGKNQTFYVGKWLKHRYSVKHNFLNLTYDSSQIYTFAEDRDESLMSAQTVMAGLYPPIGHEIWNKRVHWIPTPVHTSPLFLDNVVGRGVNCPNYEKDFEKASHGRFIRTTNKKDRDLLDTVSRHTGGHFTHVTQLPALYNILSVEKAHNLSLPAWTDTIYPHLLGKTVLDVALIRTKNQELAKLSVGPLFDLIRDRFDSILKNDPNVGSLKDGNNKRKFNVIVGNDTLIYDTLHGLKIVPTEVVNPAATLVFELIREKSGKIIVKLLFRNSDENSKVQELKIDGSKGVKCPYAKFNSTVSALAVTFDQWSKLCYKIKDDNKINLR